MDAAKVKALLSSLSVQGSGVSTEVGIRDGIPYLKFSRDSDPDDFAVVTTPGDRWYELDVRGGFGAIRFDEGASDAEVAEIVEAYVKAAIAYLEGRRTTIRSRVLKMPAVRVETDDGPVDLRLSLVDGVKALFRPRYDGTEERR